MEYCAERLEAELKRLEREGRKGLRRLLDTDPEHNRKALRAIRQVEAEVTFGQFRVVMEQRNHDVDELVQLFRGKIDDPRDFFARVMSCQSRNRDEDRSDVVIPDRSVNQFYRQELHYFSLPKILWGERGENPKTALTL